MNVNEIATRVKRQFGDEASIQITNDDVIRWVNDGQRELAIQNDLLQTAATAAIVAGQDQYFLPPDILTLRSVRVAGRRIEPISFEQAAPNFTGEARGVPCQFSNWANRIDLYPTPNYSDANDLQLYYTRIPVAVVSLADVPEIPVQYHGRLVDYCLQQAYELDENWAAAQVKGEQFQRGAQELKGRDTVQEYYPSIVSVEDFSYGG